MLKDVSTETLIRELVKRPEGRVELARPHFLVDAYQWNPRTVAKELNLKSEDLINPLEIPEHLRIYYLRNVLNLMVRQWGRLIYTQLGKAGQAGGIGVVSITDIADVAHNISSAGGHNLSCNLDVSGRNPRVGTDIITPNAKTMVALVEDLGAPDSAVKPSIVDTDGAVKVIMSVTWVGNHWVEDETIGEVALYLNGFDNVSHWIFMVSRLSHASGDFVKFTIDHTLPLTVNFHLQLT